MAASTVHNSTRYKKIDCDLGEKAVDAFITRYSTPIDHFSNENISKLAEQLVTSLGKLSINPENRRSIAETIHNFVKNSSPLRKKTLTHLMALQSKERPGISDIALMLLNPESYFRPFTERLWEELTPEIERKTPGGLDFFRICAHFAVCPIPAKWVAPFCNLDHAIYGSGQDREKKMKVFVAMLYGHRILRSDPLKPQTFYIPKKFSSIIRRKDEFQTAVRILMQALDLQCFENPEDWPSLRWWKYHARSILHSSFVNMISPEDLLMIHTALSRISVTIDINFEHAQHHLHRVATIQRDLQGSCQKSIFLYATWGEIYSALGEHKKAILKLTEALTHVDRNLFVEILPLLQQIPQCTSLKVKEEPTQCELEDVEGWKSRLLSALGEECYHYNNLDIALRLQERALEMESNRDQSLLSATIYNRLARVHARREDYQRMMGYCRSALDHQPQIALETAYAHKTIGESKEIRENMDDAFWHYGEAKRILEALYPRKNHPALATIYTRLGIMNRHQGGYDLSQTNLSKALEIQNQLFQGRVHLDQATTHEELGRLYLELNKFSPAIEHFIKAYEVCLVWFSGDHHPITARNAFHVGRASQRARDYAQAGDYYRQAIAIQEAICGDGCDLNLAQYYNNMGTLLSSTNEYAEALLFHNKAIAMREALFPDQNHHDLAQSYNNIAVTYTFMEDYSTAFTYHQKALIIRQTIGLEEPGNALAIAHSYNHIGNLYVNMGNSTSAASAYREALRLSEQFQGPKTDTYQRNLDRVGH